MLHFKNRKNYQIAVFCTDYVLDKSEKEMSSALSDLNLVTINSLEDTVLDYEAFTNDTSTDDTASEYLVTNDQNASIGKHKCSRFQQKILASKTCNMKMDFYQIA